MRGGVPDKTSSRSGSSMSQKGEGEVGLSSCSTHTPSAQSNTLVGVWSVWTVLFVLACRICAAVGRFASTVIKKQPNAVGVLFFFFGKNTSQLLGAADGEQIGKTGHCWTPCATCGARLMSAIKTVRERSLLLRVDNSSALRPRRPQDVM